MIYVASPYTSPNAEVMQHRYETVRDFVGRATLNEFIVYSPIVHFHEVAKSIALPRNYSFYKHINLHMLALASSMWVLCMSGWEDSNGVNDEIKFCTLNGIEVIYIEHPHGRMPSM